MKEISVSLWEIDIEEIEKLPAGTQILEFYPLFNTYAIRQVGISKFFNKFKYFLFNEPVGLPTNEQEYVCKHRETCQDRSWHCPDCIYNPFNY